MNALGTIMGQQKLCTVLFFKKEYNVLIGDGYTTFYKDRKAVRAKNLFTVLSHFGKYLTTSSSDQAFLLIAHNGNSTLTIVCHPCART